jgi:Zn-dependent peptidase ImmA (M78 family)/DNA-binding XRE family transcriptional regulator
VIGSRLRLVREICGLTQLELGELIGTTQSGVASLEAGIYRPSQTFLDTIARRTGFSVGFIDKEETQDFPFGSLLYRVHASVRPSDRTRAHGLAVVTFELATMLSSKLKRVPVNIPKLDEDPERCAQITRASLGLSPHTPIRGLLRSLERKGVWIFSLPLEVDGFDGFSTWVGNDDSRPVIALLQGKTPFREVFTAGEEVAHLVMHSPLRGVNAQDADKEARQFAQEFLLPEEAMRAEMPQPVTLSSLAALKPRWGVSLAFLAKRAESLELLTRNQCRYLIQQMRSRWGAKIEPGDDAIVPEKPRMLQKMAEMVYGDPINLARLSKDSGLSPDLLRQLLNLESSRARILEFRKL